MRAAAISSWMPGSWVMWRRSRKLGWYLWQPLSVACEREGIPMGDGHSAIGDCRLTLALLRKLASYGASQFSRVTDGIAEWASRMLAVLS